MTEDQGAGDHPIAVSMAAQKVCRSLGIGHFPPAWSYLGREE